MLEARPPGGPAAGHSQGLRPRRDFSNDPLAGVGAARFGNRAFPTGMPVLVPVYAEARGLVEDHGARVLAAGAESGSLAAVPVFGGLGEKQGPGHGGIGGDGFGGFGPCAPMFPQVGV